MNNSEPGIIRQEMTRYSTNKQKHTEGNFQNKRQSHTSSKKPSLFTRYHSTLPYSVLTRRFTNVDDSIPISVVYILPLDVKLVLPSLMRAGSSTTSLATSLVTSAVEVRSRAARNTPSLPGKISAPLWCSSISSAVARWRDIRFSSAATIWLITAAGSATGYSTPGARALGGAKSDLDLRPPGDPHTSGQSAAGTG
ncbi:hypothetical protein T08_11311 [Trichinella sp. T8]|nr:hypothetical protein T08_11311 [Trichinella sp. T8]